MKRLLKVFSIVLICLLVVCGCNDELEGEEFNLIEKEKEPIIDQNTDLEKLIATNEVAFFNGEFNDKTIVLKVQNNNSRPVYLNYSFEVFDKSKTKLYNKEVYVRVGSNNVAYVIAIQDLEESTFDSYTYKMTVLKDKLENYDSIKSGIKSDYSDNGKSITATFTNNGNRTTTVYGWLFFYKDNKIVAVKDATSYNLTPSKTNNVKVDYPIKTVKKKIPFDRVNLIVNEVSTEL